MARRRLRPPETAPHAPTRAYWLKGACPHPPRGQLKLVYRQHPPTQGGGSGCRAAGQAGGGGGGGALALVRPRRRASWSGVGGAVRAPGDPGRLLVAPAQAAAQGVCGNDTARAAEIPPPDIGWKVEQLVRDNQWRSIAARRGRAARGRGICG